MKRHLTKRRAVVLTIAASVLAATAAFVYFTTLGSGTGSAQTGSVAGLTITQVGAGYDSLVTTNDPNTEYIQDQCFDCAEISQFGNSIHLANSGLQRLVSAVVAFRNWGDSVTVPITLSINGGPSSTTNFTIPAVQGNGRPTTFNVPFQLPDSPVRQRHVRLLDFVPDLVQSCAVGSSRRRLERCLVELRAPALGRVGHHAGDGVGSDRCHKRNRNRWRLPAVHHDDR